MSGRRQLRLVAGYGALVAALAVACGGRVTDVGSPGEPVHEDGGGPDSWAGPTDAGHSDGFMLVGPDAGSGEQPGTCCCINSGPHSGCPFAGCPECPDGYADDLPDADCDAYCQCLYDNGAGCPASSCTCPSPGGPYVPDGR
jgi:hypothetical protein